MGPLLWIGGSESQERGQCLYHAERQPNPDVCFPGLCFSHQSVPLIPNPTDPQTDSLRPLSTWQGTGPREGNLPISSSSYSVPKCYQL